jgi:hypothetical protein
MCLILNSTFIDNETLLPSVVQVKNTHILKLKYIYIFRKASQILFFCILFSISFFANGQLLLSESFNYTANATNGLRSNSGGLWTNLNTGDSILTVNGNLSYPGYPTSVGNKIQFDGDGIDVIRFFSPQSTIGSTIYGSFLLKITQLGSLNTTGGYFFSLTSSNTNYAACVHVRRTTTNATTFQLGISTRSTSTIAWNTQLLNPDSTYLIVAGHQFISGASNDVSKLWINPSAFGVASEPTPSTTAAPSTDISPITAVLLRQSSSLATPFVELDEIRVATTWADALPQSVPCSTPINQPQSFQIIDTGSVTISGVLTKPTPSADSYLYVISATPTLNQLPTDGISYNVGDDIDDASVIAVSDNSNITLSGLNPNSNYYLFIFAFNTNCTGGPLYQTANPLQVSFTTKTGLQPCVAPNTQPSALAFSNLTPFGLLATFTSASDADEYLIVRTNNQALNNQPLNGTTYNKGDLIGNGIVVDRVAIGAFTADSLLPSTTYSFYVFSLRSQNCTGGPSYLSLNPLMGNVTTTALSANCISPIAQPTSLILTGDQNSLNGNFTASQSAQGYLVLLSTSTTLTQSPSNGTNYQQGQLLGNARVVYSGSGTSFFTNGLNPSTTYSLFVFSYNNLCTNGIVYLPTNPLTGQFTTSSTATLNHYFGNLHAHSSYSDGNKDSTHFTPAEDYAYAKNSLQMDFLGISEHNHATAGMIKANYNLGIAQANAATNSTFVALYGQEWGVISGGGHLLVYGIDSLIGWEANNYDVFVAKNDYLGTAGLFKKLRQQGQAFVSYAHPNSSDYGNLSNIAFNAMVDSCAIGCAVESGPAFSTATNYNDYPASMSFLSYYLKMLSKGYHIGPFMDHDTHYTNFGRANENRLVVLAPSLTKANLYAALKSRRFYATQDMDTRVNFTINNEPVGSIMTGGTAPTISVTATDPTSPTATINMRLMYGVPGSGVLATQLTSTNTGVLNYTDNNLVTGNTRYYYLDITINGKRTITAPIWYQKTSTTSASANLQASTSLTESNLSGSTVVINLTNTQLTDFVSNPTTLNAGLFVLNQAPLGTTIQTAVATSATSVTLTIGGSAQDFDTDITNLSVTLSSSLLSNGTAITTNVISITARNEQITAGTINTFSSQLRNTTSTPNTFVVSGQQLSGSLRIVAPVGFQVSLSIASGYADSVVINPNASGTVSNTTVYVRFAPTQPWLYASSIQIRSNKAISKTSAVTGTGFVTATVCDSLQVRSTVYRTSGFYAINYLSVSGQDSTAYTQLTVNSSVIRDTTASACGSFNWYGTNYTLTEIYTRKVQAANGCDSTIRLNLTITNCAAVLHVKIWLEAFVKGNAMSATLYDLGISNDSTATDTVKVQLWKPTKLNQPQPDHSVSTILHKNGMISSNFPSSVLNKAYYICIKHRNSLEIWSSDSVMITAQTNYDFTTDSLSAYNDGIQTSVQRIGNNRFALFSGDVNQDGTIDILDLIETQNKATEFEFGYFNSDCNGDGVTDLLDLQYMENNGNRFLFISRPQ